MSVLQVAPKEVSMETSKAQWITMLEESVPLGREALGEVWRITRVSYHFQLRITEKELEKQESERGEEHVWKTEAEAKEKSEQYTKAIETINNAQSLRSAFERTLEKNTLSNFGGNIEGKHYKITIEKSVIPTPVFTALEIRDQHGLSWLSGTEGTARWDGTGAPGTLVGRCPFNGYADLSNPIEASSGDSLTLILKAMVPSTVAVNVTAQPLVPGPEVPIGPFLLFYQQLPTPDSARRLAY